MLGKRPGWYFDKGKHGGTLNDIGIHAVDLIPWITGLTFTRVEAARSWNAFATETPWMHDAGQFMATLENGAGVMGEVSYFAPDSLGYAMPQYWRITFFGRAGVLEMLYTQKKLMLARNGSKEAVYPDPLPDNPGGYLKAFQAEIDGTVIPGAITTADILRASRQCLLIQNAGDKGLTHVAM
jgi:predicted dehydrogenase